MRSVVRALLLLLAAACGRTEAPPDQRPPRRDEITVTISPASATVDAGKQVAFVAKVQGTGDKSVRWGASNGTIDDEGTLTAPLTHGHVEVTATSQADGNAFATAFVTVVSEPAPPDPISVFVSPAEATLLTDGVFQFTASVIGGNDTRVVWSTDHGSVDANGLFHAPGYATTAQVTARSLADASASAAASITVKPTDDGIRIYVSPLNADAVTMRPDKIQFTATVSGTDAKDVTWSIQEGEPFGTIDESGLYEPPQRQSFSSVIHVVATSRADPSKSAVAEVRLLEELVDHGGGVVPSIRTFVVWWGTSSEFPAGVRPMLEGVLKGLNGSSYVATLDQYMRGSTATVAFAGSFDEPSPPSTGDPPPDELISVACGALQSHGISPESSDLILVASSRATNAYCGWHSWMKCGDKNVLLVYLPNAEGFCSYNTKPCPGGADAAAASMVSTATHELAESMTNPWGDAWHAAGEIATKCGSDVCVALPTGTFLVSQLYSNEAHACVP